MCMHMKYKLLAETLFLESSDFRGEFWIQDHYVQSADANIDMGHEAIVIQSAASQVLSDIGISVDEPYLPDMDDEIYEAIQDDLPEEMQTQYADGEISAKDCLKYYGKHVLRNAKFDELVDAAYDRIDVRRFAMREWGWKAIRGIVVDTWSVTPEDLSQISYGLNEAYAYDIEEYDSEKVDEHGNKGPYFDIEVYSRGDYYNSVPLDLIGQDISKILPYRTYVRGQRITESGELVGKIDLKKPELKKDPSLQTKLDALSDKYKNHLSTYTIAYNEYIDLDKLLAKKDAPVGTGSAFMKELCDIADEHNRIIVLQTAPKGSFRDKPGGYFYQYKTTSSSDRLKRFYGRFGFVSNYNKRDYRPDLRGNMHRNPINKL